LVEFRSLLKRCAVAKLQPIIDFVPNHVARSYGSDVMPNLSFGRDDDVTRFFDRDNNFYYLSSIHPGSGPPLRLPAGNQPGCDGLFEPESKVGRVTGNNVVSWAPALCDWYETVKLNYGHDFTTGRDTSHLPGREAHRDSVPDTWRKMDAVLEFWQQMGVGGFRVDMAHMVPMEFWGWVIHRSRQREREVFFMAEAYDGDPAKLTEDDVVGALLKAGFDGVYDGPLYHRLQELYEGQKWANDIDELVWAMDRIHTMVRYVENHDEVRLANPQRWGGLGARVGRAASAVAFGIGGGPVMVYNGQEVGEPAVGAEGFSGDDGRSSIFDYGALPELAKWVNGHRYDGGGLSEAQAELREWYAKLVRLCAEPGLERGWFYGLNHANKENRNFGRLMLESTSGHWLYAFLRSERRPGGQTFLVVVNMHGEETMADVRIWIPEHALGWLALRRDKVIFRDRLATDWEGEVERAQLPLQGLALPDLAPCSALFLEVG
jgi:glycosidase